MLDSGSLVKIDKQALIDVPGELSGLLEAVVDAESRFQLFFKPHRLKRLAALPVGAEVKVQVGQLGELDGVLRYRGPLTAGSAAVHFGVQLKVRDSSVDKFPKFLPMIFVSRFLS